MSQTVISNAAIVINTDKSVREIRALLESLNTLSTPISSLITILGNLDKQGGSGLSNLKTNLEQVATVGNTVATNFRKINTAFEQVPQNIEKTATSLIAVQEKLTNLVKSSLHLEVTANSTQIDSLQQKVSQLLIDLKLLQKVSTNTELGVSRTEKLSGRFQGLKKEVESIIELYKKLKTETIQNVSNLGTPKFDRAGLETNLGLLSDLSTRAVNAYQSVNLLGIGINSLTSTSESTKQLQENFTNLQRTISLTSESLRKSISSGTGISELTLLEKITSDNKRQFLDFRDTITDSVAKIKEDFKLLKTDNKFITTEASQEEIARLAGAVVATKEKFAEFNLFLSRLNFKNLDDQIAHIKTTLGSGAETNPLVQSLIELRDLVNGFKSGKGLPDGISPFKNMTAELSAISKQTDNLSNAWNKINSEELNAENKLKEIQEVLKVIQTHVNEGSLSAFKRSGIDKLITDEIKLQNLLGELKAQFASFSSELQNTAGFEALNNKIKQLESSIEEASLKITGFRTAYSRLRADDVLKTAASKGIEGSVQAEALKTALINIENIIKEIGTNKDAVNITAQLKESQNAAKVLESDLIKILSQLKTLLNSATLNKQPLIKKEVLQIFNELSAELTTLQAKQKELATQAAPKLNLLNLTEGLSKANNLFNQLLNSVIEFEKETRSSNFGKSFVNVEDLRKMLLDGRAVNSELTAMRNKLLNLRTKIDLLPESSRAEALQVINRALGEVQNTAVRLAPSLSIINRQIQSFGDMPALPAGFGGYALSLRQMTAEGAKLSTLFDRVGNAVRNVFGTNASAQVDQYRESFKHLEEQLIQFRSGVVIWSIGLQMLGQSILKPITDATTHFLELSDTMAMVKGVMNATGSAFEQLQQTAITWGAVTRFTSQEVAQGLLQLGKAGFTAAQSMQVLPATLNLAQAAGIDLARSTEIVSNITQGFEIALEKLPYAADVLTKGFTTSNATLENLGYGMAYVGALSKGFGINLEDVVGALAKLNTAGLKGCHDDKTEILTKDRGFILFKDLVPEDQVMTINKDTLQMEWQYTDGKIYEFDIDEPIFRIKSKCMDYAVTDNHRLFIETRYGTRKIVEAKDFTEGRFFRTGIWQGENKDNFTLPGFIQDRGSWKKQIPSLELPMRDWVDFLGWYFSEGCLCKDNGGNYKVTISQSDVNSAKVKILTECLQKLPFNFNKSGVNFSCINQQLYKELITYGKGFSNLHIPQYVKDLPIELLHVFLDSFTLGDGDNYGKIYVSNSVLADDIYEILLKCGYGAYKKQCIIKGEKRKIGNREITATQNGYYVSRTTAYNKPYMNVSFESKKDLDKQQIFWEHYKGKVYSVSVPNTLIFVRRNGKGVFSGNTLAGTALRGTLDALFNPTKDEAKLLQDLALRMGETSFSIKNANGDFIGFVELIKKLEKAGMTSGEALRLFGQRAGPGAAALLRVGSKALEDYIDQLKLSEGTTARIGKNAEESLKGRVLIMTSAFEGLQEVFGKSLEAPLRVIVDTITVFLNKLQALHDTLGPVAVLFDRIIAGLAVLVSGLGAATFSWFLLLVPAIQFIAFAHTLIGLMSGMIKAGQGVNVAMNTAAVGTAAASTATWGFSASLNASTGAIVENTIATGALGTAQKSQAASAAAASIAQAKNNAALLLGSRIAESTFTLFTQLKEIALGTLSIIGLGIANSFITPLKGAYLQVGSFAGSFANLKGVLERFIIVSRISVGVLGVSLVDSLRKMQAAFVAYKISALTAIETNGKLAFSLATLRSLTLSLANGFIYLARFLVGTPVGWVILLISLFSLLKEPLTIVNAELEKQQERLKASENNVISYGKSLQKTLQELTKFQDAGGKNLLIGNKLNSVGTLDAIGSLLDSLKELEIGTKVVTDDKGFINYFANVENAATKTSEPVLVFSTNIDRLAESSRGLNKVLEQSGIQTQKKELEISSKLLQGLVAQYGELQNSISNLESASRRTDDLKKQSEFATEHAKLISERARLEEHIGQIIKSTNLTEENRLDVLKSLEKSTNSFLLAQEKGFNLIKALGNTALKVWDTFLLAAQKAAKLPQILAGFIVWINDRALSLLGVNTEIDKTLDQTRKKILEVQNTISSTSGLPPKVINSWNDFTKLLISAKGQTVALVESSKESIKKLEDDFNDITKSVETYTNAVKVSAELSIGALASKEKTATSILDQELQTRIAALKQSTTDEHSILYGTLKITQEIEQKKIAVIKQSNESQLQILESAIAKQKGLVTGKQQFDLDKELLTKKQSVYDASLAAEKQYLDRLLSMRESVQNKIRALAAERFDFKQNIADIQTEFDAHVKGLGKISEAESEVTNFKRREVEIRKLITKGEYENARKLLEQNKSILASLVKSPEKLSVLGTNWQSEIQSFIDFMKKAENQTGRALEDKNKEALASLNESIDITNSKIQELVEALNNVATSLASLGKQNFEAINKTFSDETLSRFRKMSQSLDLMKGFTNDLASGLSTLNTKGFVDLLKFINDTGTELNTVDLKLESVKKTIEKGDFAKISDESIATVGSYGSKLEDILKILPNLKAVSPDIFSDVNLQNLQSLLSNVNTLREEYKKVAEVAKQSNEGPDITKAKQAFNQWLSEIDKVKTAILDLSVKGKQFLGSNFTSLSSDVSNSIQVIDLLLAKAKELSNNKDITNVPAAKNVLETQIEALKGLKENFQKGLANAGSKEIQTIVESFKTLQQVSIPVEITGSLSKDEVKKEINDVQKITEEKKLKVATDVSFDKEKVQEESTKISNDIKNTIQNGTKAGITLNVNSSNIKATFDTLNTSINEFKQKEIPLTLVANKESTLQDISNIFSQAQALTAKGVKVNVDFSAVSENLRKIRTELETKTQLKPTVELTEVDKAKSKVRELSRQIEIVDKMSGSVSLFSDPQIALLDLMLDRLDQMLVLLGNAAKESNLEENLGPSITALQNNFTSLAASIKESLQQAFNSLDFSQLVNFINTIITQLSGLVALISIQFLNMSEFESFRQKWEELKDKTITLTANIQGGGAGVIAAKTGGFISEPIRLFGQGGLNFFRPSYSKVPGNGVGDHVPALLEPGEFIIRKSVVNQVGLSFLDALNRGNIAFHQAGGEIASLTQRLSAPNIVVKKFAQGGAVTSNKLDFVDVNLSIGNDPKSYKVKGAREEVASLVAALKKVQRGA